jgi:hypothetical protein
MIVDEFTSGTYLNRLGRPDMAHAVKDWNPYRHD